MPFELLELCGWTAARGFGVKVIYVAGWMRSGTTLLSEVLGAQPGCFNAGEVSGIWSAAARGDGCSCGQRLTTCEVWGRALRESTKRAGLDEGDYGRLAAQLQRYFRTRRLVSLHGQLRAPSRMSRPERQVLTATSDLLSVAMATVGAGVLIDSSKLAPGVYLHALNGNEVGIAHLVRSPVGIVASERRTLGASPMNVLGVPPGSGVAASLLKWHGANLSVQGAARALRTSYVVETYENLLAEPGARVARLSQRLGFEFDAKTLRGSTVNLSDTHVAEGNPSRFDGTTRELVVDDRWRHELSDLEQLGVRIVTAPTYAYFRRLSSGD